MMDINRERAIRVLIAEDDDDDFLFFTLATLETHIHVTLKRVENGMVLMKELDQGIPDLLFMDLQMPLKDGRECLKGIRSNGNFASLPVIVFTSYTDFYSVDFCYAHGANLYITKPTKISTLAKMLSDVFCVDWPTPLSLPHRQGFVLEEQTG